MHILYSLYLNSFQAYTGAYRQDMQKGKAVEIVSELKMEVGQMVAIWLIDSKTEPTIGKYLEHTLSSKERVNFGWAVQGGGTRIDGCR